MTKRKPDLEISAEDIQVYPPSDRAALEQYDECLGRLIESGIVDESDKPVFRPGHLEHLAREYARLGKQEAWRLYADDLTVAFAFYRDEFEALVAGQGE